MASPHWFLEVEATKSAILLVAGHMRLPALSVCPNCLPPERSLFCRFVPGSQIAEFGAVLAVDSKQVNANHNFKRGFEKPD
jgi:hypothetical protein